MSPTLENTLLKRDNQKLKRFALAVAILILLFGITFTVFGRARPDRDSPKPKKKATVAAKTTGRDFFNTFDNYANPVAEVTMFGEEASVMADSINILGRRIPGSSGKAAYNLSILMNKDLQSIQEARKTVYAELGKIDNLREYAEDEFIGSRSELAASLLHTAHRHRLSELEYLGFRERVATRWLDLAKNTVGVKSGTMSKADFENFITIYNNEREPVSDEGMTLAKKVDTYKIQLDKDFAKFKKAMGYK